jgi:hypothetical protein
LQNVTKPAIQTSNALKRLLKPTFWFLILAIVAWFVVQAFGEAEASFSKQRFSLGQLDLHWLGLAGLAYILGLLPCWWFWCRSLKAMGQAPPIADSLQAYYIGHLGKYVPGKALVVVLRTVFIRGPNVDTTIAATTVFVETLTMMAVGAFLAAVILVFTFSHSTLVVLAICMAIGAGLPTFPPIFRRLVKILKVGRESDHPGGGIDFKLIALGWLAMVPCWTLLGVSMLLTLKSMEISRIPGGVFWSDLPYLVATVALAMVAGFLSLLPGGVWARDIIVVQLIASHPRFGADVAIISAVVLRVVWLVSELAVSGILYLTYVQRSNAPPDGPPVDASNSGNTGS